MTPWHQQTVEPFLWHGRFKNFLALGSSGFIYATFAKTCLTMI